MITLRILLAAGTVLLTAVRTSAEASSPAAPQPTDGTKELTPQATALLRSVLLAAIPEVWIDDGDWGQTRRVQSGVSVRMDRGVIRTRRRWKQVPHGIWRRAEIRLRDPNRHFTIRAVRLPSQDSAESRYRVDAAARLHVRGWLQNWVHGTRLYSVSGDAIADVSLTATVRLARRIAERNGSRCLRLRPRVDTISLHVTGFSLRRLSHVGGAAAREFGRSLRSLINRQAATRGPRIAKKINAAIDKNAGWLDIPLGALAVFVTDDHASGPDANVEPHSVPDPTDRPHR